MHILKTATFIITSIEVCHVIGHNQFLDMAEGKSISTDSLHGRRQVDILNEGIIEGVVSYRSQTFGQHHLVQEVHRGIAVAGTQLELVGRNFCELCLAKVKLQERGHHLDSSPVITVHCSFHFQATNILNVVCIVQYLSTKATRF